MKKVVSALGTACVYFFGFLIVLAALPLILGAVILFGTPSLYGRLWAMVRRDPKRNLRIAELQDETREPADTKEAFIESFTKLNSTIARLSDAKLGNFTYNEPETPKKQGQKADWTSPDDEVKGAQEDNWTELSLSQTLKSEHATIKVSLEFGSFRMDNGQQHVGMADGDDQCCTAFPPVTADVVLPRLQTKRSFTLLSSESVWIVISFLRGDVKFVQPGGQLWAYIPEHKTWLVEYKANKYSYGQRSSFNNAVAREYGKDRVPVSEE